MTNSKNLLQQGNKRGESKNIFEVLGIAPLMIKALESEQLLALAETIMRKLLAFYHPDVRRDGSAEKTFDFLSSIKPVLNDPVQFNLHRLRYLEAMERKEKRGVRDAAAIEAEIRTKVKNRLETYTDNALASFENRAKQQMEKLVASCQTDISGIQATALNLWECISPETLLILSGKQQDSETAADVKDTIIPFSKSNGVLLVVADKHGHSPYLVEQANAVEIRIRFLQLKIYLEKISYRIDNKEGTEAEAKRLLDAFDFMQFYDDLETIGFPNRHPFIRISIADVPTEITSTKTLHRIIACSRETTITPLGCLPAILQNGLLVTMASHSDRPIISGRVMGIYRTPEEQQAYWAKEKAQNGHIASVHSTLGSKQDVAIRRFRTHKQLNPDFVEQRKKELKQRVTT